MSRLVDLYPRAWQARYGDELEDLVAARPPGLSGSVDLVRGALDAHRHPELVDPAASAPTGLEPVSRQRFEDLRVARRLGLASMVGAVVWLASWLVALNGPVRYNDDGSSYNDGAAALPIFVLALVLLSAGLLGQLIRLPSRHRAARIGAIVAVFTGPIWSLGPWNLFIGVALLAALLLLAVAAWWASEWSGTAALVAVGSGLLGAAAIAVALFGWSTNVASSEGFMLIAIAAFTPIWLIVGGTLQALPEVVDSTGPAEDEKPEPALA